VTNTLTEAMTALTVAGWKPTLEVQAVAEYPDLPGRVDLRYISVSFPARSEHVVEIFVSTCDCPEEAEQDEAAHMGGAVAGNGGPPGRGFMVVYLDADGVDEVAEDHVRPEELSMYARFWLWEFPDAPTGDVRK
jgi:hypothetical protein